MVIFGIIVIFSFLIWGLIVQADRLEQRRVEREIEHTIRDYLQHGGKGTISFDRKTKTWDIKPEEPPLH